MGLDIAGFSSGLGAVLVAFLAGWGLSFVLTMFNQANHE